MTVDERQIKRSARILRRYHFTNFVENVCFTERKNYGRITDGQNQQTVIIILLTEGEKNEVHSADMG